MRTVFVLLFALISMTAAAQKPAKIYAKVQKAQDKQEYYDMADLLEKLPADEKNTSQYNGLMALALDSMHRYAACIKYYRQCLSLTKDSGTAQRLAVVTGYEEQRIAAWRAKMVRIKDCPKCHGMDSVPTDMACQRCEGRKQVKVRCTNCNGRGIINCSQCNGTGAVRTENGNVTCPRCGGSRGSQCPMRCDNGYNLADCGFCAGLGYRNTLVKCDKHD